jgi:hypothetical protein
MQTFSNQYRPAAVEDCGKVENATAFSKAGLKPAVFSTALGLFEWVTFAGHFPIAPKAGELFG